MDDKIRQALLICDEQYDTLPLDYKEAWERIDEQYNLSKIYAEATEAYYVLRMIFIVGYTEGEINHQLMQMDDIMRMVKKMRGGGEK